MYLPATPKVLHDTFMEISSHTFLLNKVIGTKLKKKKSGFEVEKKKKKELAKSASFLQVAFNID